MTKKVNAARNSHAPDPSSFLIYYSLFIISRISILKLCSKK